MIWIRDCPYTFPIPQRLGLCAGTFRRSATRTLVTSIPSCDAPCSHTSWVRGRSGVADDGR